METEVIMNYALDEASRKTRRPLGLESLWVGVRDACQALVGPPPRGKASEESSLLLLEEGVCYDQCIFLAELY